MNDQETKRALQQHHEKAAQHHEQAAMHHKEAAKHTDPATTKLVRTTLT